MPRRALRTRSRKGKQVRTPGGRLVTHYFGEKPGSPRCGMCGRELHGVSTDGRASKSEKAVSRIYGGNLCPSCLRSAIFELSYSLWAEKTAPLTEARQ